MTLPRLDENVSLLARMKREANIIRIEMSSPIITGSAGATIVRRRKLKSERAIPPPVRGGKHDPSIFEASTSLSQAPNDPSISTVTDETSQNSFGVREAGDHAGLETEGDGVGFRILGAATERGRTLHGLDSAENHEWSTIISRWFSWCLGRKN